MECGFRQWHLEVEIVLQVSDIPWCEVHRHLDCHGNRICQEHEALELVMPAFVVGNRLECEMRNARSQILFLDNFDTGKNLSAC